MTVDTTPEAEVERVPSPDWLRRLQLGLTVLSSLAVVAVALTVGVLVYAVVAVDDNGLGYITGIVHDSEAYLELNRVPGEPPQVSYGNPMGVRMQVYDVFTWLPGLVLAAVLLVLLRGVVRRARLTDPFDAETARLLRRAGWAALLGGLLAGAAERIGIGLAFMISPTVSHAPGEQIWAWVPFSLRALIFDLPWAWLAVGVALLAIAAVFSRGIEMRRDLDGLV